VLDQRGVGELIKLATERGRKTRPNLKVISLTLVHIVSLYPSHINQYLIGCLVLFVNRWASVGNMVGSLHQLLSLPKLGWIMFLAHLSGWLRGEVTITILEQY
jgi:hypothetical protein